jgi:hypothetical protein
MNKSKEEKKMLSLIDFIKECLAEKGYGGLYYHGECACEIGNIFPCGKSANLLECRPGYKKPASPESGYDSVIVVIGPEK